MNNTTMNTKIGTLNVGGIDILNDEIDIYLPIEVVSEDLQDIINEKIEEEKKDFEKFFIEIDGIEEHHWSEEQYIYGQQLHIVVLGGTLTYEIVTSFKDTKDEFMDSFCNLEVDLSEYEAEIKKLICMALINKFF